MTTIATAGGKAARFDDEEETACGKAARFDDEEETAAGTRAGNGAITRSNTIDITWA